MSMAEMKEQISAMTKEERLEIAALIAFLNRRDDPEHLAELERRLADMDAGRKFSEEQIRAILAARDQ